MWKNSCMGQNTAIPGEIKSKDGTRMILIPAGEFWMGSPAGIGKDNERPRHRVFIDAFYMDEHEVTFDQYDQPVRFSRGVFRGDRVRLKISDTGVFELDYSNLLG